MGTVLLLALHMSVLAGKVVNVWAVQLIRTMKQQQITLNRHGIV